MWQASGLHRLTSALMSVGSLGCDQWGTQTHVVLTSVGLLGWDQWGTQVDVCAHVSWVVGVHLFFCRLHGPDQAGRKLSPPEAKVVVQAFRTL